MNTDLPQFKLGDFVKTIKGAPFWGEIIAFDNDEKLPGCTVRAIAPGFEGIKHVYPLKQLAIRTFLDSEVMYNDPEGIIAMGAGNGNGQRFVYGSSEAIHQVRRWLVVAEAAAAHVHALYGQTITTPTGAALCDAVKAYDETA